MVLIFRVLTDGLGLFDAYRFTRYDTIDGLGKFFINSISEDHQGRVWVATNGGGVASFIDWVSPNSSAADPPSAAPRKFVSFRLSDQEDTNRVNALVFDSEGRLRVQRTAASIAPALQPAKSKGSRLK
jgi:hypothetical protein